MSGGAAYTVRQRRQQHVGVMTETASEPRNTLQSNEREDINTRFLLDTTELSNPGPKL